MTTTPDHLVLFDGVCGLCDRTVQFLLEHDRAGRLRFAPLGGPTAEAVVARHPALRGVDSVVYVARTEAGEAVHVRSKAVFQLAGQLEGPARGLRVFSFLPQRLADAAYDSVAAARYRIFGRLESCRVPDASVRARFLP